MYAASPIDPYLRALLVGILTWAFRYYGLPRLFELSTWALIIASMVFAFGLRALQYSWFVVLVAIGVADIVIITIILLLVAPNLPRWCFGSMTVVTRTEARSAMAVARAPLSEGEEGGGEDEGEDDWSY